MYSEGGPIVSTYTASYGVPKIVFAMPLSRNMTLDGVTYTGLAVSYDTDVVDDLVDGSMYGGQSDCYIVRANGDIVLALEPQTELCEGLTNLYDLDAHADWIYGTMDDIKDCVQLGRSGSAQFTCQGGRNYLVAIPTAFPDWTLVGIIRADEVDGAMHSVQQSTIIALGALCIFAVIIVVLALGMESQLRLRREEEERLSLEREKMQSDRLLQSMSRIVDRYSIVNLDTDRYRYSELRLSEDEVCPLRELRFVGFSGHAADQRVIGVDFKRVVLFRHGLTRGFEHAAHLLRQHLILGSDHAGRGVNETGRHLHILNLAAERLLQTFNESLMLLLGLFLLLLFFLVL